MGVATTVRGACSCCRLGRALELLDLGERSTALVRYAFAFSRARRRGLGRPLSSSGCRGRSCRPSGDLHARAARIDSTVFAFNSSPRSKRATVLDETLAGSCPEEWCKSDAGHRDLRRGWPEFHAADTADSMMMGSLLKGAMVSRLM
jgi:hypothetical protein